MMIIHTYTHTRTKKVIENNAHTAEILARAAYSAQRTNPKTTVGPDPLAMLRKGIKH